MSANKEFDKEEYLLTEIGGVPYFQRTVESVLSDALQNVTKQDMDEFKDPRYSLHRYALRSDLLHLVTCCQNQYEYKIAHDDYGVQKETARQEEIKKRVILGLDSIKETEKMTKPTSLGDLFSSVINFFR